MLTVHVCQILEASKRRDATVIGQVSKSIGIILGNPDS